MEIISVITIENDVIQNVESYKKDDVELAEKAFLDKAREYGWTPDEISESDVLDEGRYETEFQIYANVNLVWSTIKNTES
jgi:hypothetical protein